jgi:hypothetical protein
MGRHLRAIRQSALDDRMPSAAADQSSFPPRVALLLPVVLLLHQAEEWFGGFPEWTSLAVGNGVEAEEFLLINAVGFVLFTTWTLAAFRERRMAWIVASLATLLGLNGVLHAVASILVDRYSPGTATGLLLSLPFSVVVLRAAVAELPRWQVFGAIVAGVLFHGAVTFLALA